MIVIHVDTMEDTARLKKTYEGLENVTLLYNPTKEEVVAQLKRDDDPLVMCLGHGSSSGLFNRDWFGYVVDHSMVDLLRGRQVIGIWCFASSFAERYGLQGYFTSMFVSNINEAEGFGFPDNTNEDILNEVNLFCETINTYLKGGLPLDEWVPRLQASCHKEKDFVKYNYEGMRCFA